MKKFTLCLAILAMAAMGAKAQTVAKALNEQGEPTFDWSKASNFMPIMVGDAEYEAMKTKGIKADLRVDDQVKHLWVWEKTYNAGDGSGMNSFGQLEDHLALTVSNVGWSGMGITSDTPVDFSDLDDTYVLHFAIKGNPANAQCIGFCDAKFALGDNAFVDNGTTVKNLGTWKNDGEWYYVDVPISVLKKIMDPWSTANGGQKAYKSNYFWALSGGTQGVELHLDNIFIYKSSTLTPSFAKGDVNGDGQVNVTDVTVLVNIILGTVSDSSFVSRADLDGNGTVNVTDATTLVNMILSKN
ncbi:dockerin type I repeat-containing protein [Sodaliphilus pleomorphus]|uniref:dockerin type I repeat-containing protein n=1 Tax=Sodaliphilus pleomorphus TaxID=2606626 RepID=UPI00240998B0|nr:dockerin type I repeat-containing protein [Sodaliphilus pleomorphus]MDD6687776.1 dockerin type I repeat-containing protein [Sodaliphilus pleomorphus]